MTVTSKLIINEKEADFLASAMNTALKNEKLTEEEKEQMTSLYEKFKVNDNLTISVVED